MSGRAHAVWIALAFALSPPAKAQEKKPEPPRVTACAPLGVSPGTTSTVRFRGLRLDSASEFRFVPEQALLQAELKEKKKADTLAGLDAKDVGDTQVEVKLTLPVEFPPGWLKFQIKTDGGWTAERELRVVDAAKVFDEKEPNGGFREAQRIDRTKLLRGVIKEDKDVDVFAFEASAGERLEARVFAARGASLLDPVLTIFDARGQLVCTSDDSADGRDPRVTATVPSAGKYFVSIQDANDRGGAFFTYALEWGITP